MENFPGECPIIWMEKAIWQKNTWIDGTYYAGEDGSMTKESWIYVDENEGSMKSGWYYLGRNGKVEKK